MSWIGGHCGACQSYSLLTDGSLLCWDTAALSVKDSPSDLYCLTVAGTTVTTATSDK